MITLRHNADAGPDNFYKASQSELLAKGVAKPALNFYTATIADKTAIAGNTLTTMDIGGQTYAFGTPVATNGTDQDLKNDLGKQIADAVEAHNTYLKAQTPKQEILTTGKLLEIEITGNRLDVFILASAVVFDSIGDGTTDTNFVATESVRP